MEASSLEMLALGSRAWGATTFVVVFRDESSLTTSSSSFQPFLDVGGGGARPANSCSKLRTNARSSWSADDDFGLTTTAAALEEEEEGTTTAFNDDDDDDDDSFGVC